MLDVNANNGVTQMAKRIGPKMAAAVAYVESRGGKDVPNRDVCHAVNPHPHPCRNEKLGYDIVSRAVAAGLLVRTAGRRGRLLSLPE